MVPYFCTTISDFRDAKEPALWLNFGWFMTGRYVSLRLDGRVRGSGVGIPSWQAMSRQLPPIKGIWGGALDGMDGRV